MDGGGMKGLAIVQLLRALEKRLGRPLHTVFDLVVRPFVISAECRLTCTFTLFLCASKICFLLQHIKVQSEQKSDKLL
jgi:hypothetical protein